MALLQISEPGQTATPHQHKLAVGIDLGTTNSLVAAVRSGKADTLPDADGDKDKSYSTQRVVDGRQYLL